MKNRFLRRAVSAAMAIVMVLLIVPFGALSTAAAKGEFDVDFANGCMLGYGFNALEGNISEPERSQVAILDVDALEAAGYGAMLVPLSSTKGGYMSSENIVSITNEYNDTFSVEVGVKIPISVVNLGVNTKFSNSHTTSTEKTQSELYQMYYAEAKRGKLYISNYDGDAEELMPHVSSTFAEKIELIKNAESESLRATLIDELFAYYGTHLITSYNVGGRLEITNHMVSTEVLNKEAFEDATSIGIDVGIAGVGLGVKTGFTSTNQTSEKNTSVEQAFNIYSLGGVYEDINSFSSEKYGAWLESVGIADNSNFASTMAPLGFVNDYSLLGIWELIEDEEVRSAVYSYFNAEAQNACNTYYQQFTNDMKVEFTDYVYRSADIVKANGDVVNYYSHVNSTVNQADRYVAPGSILHLNIGVDSKWLTKEELSYMFYLGIDENGEKIFESTNFEDPSKNKIKWATIDSEKGILCIDPDSNLAKEDLTITVAAVAGKSEFATITFIVKRPTNFAEGYGTESRPYLIANDSQLNHLIDNVKAHYRLIDNIDYKSAVWQTVAPSNSAPFTGSFDGNGYTISNLAGGAFIGYNNGDVKNVSFKNANITSGANHDGRHYYAGIVVGQNSGTIENCHVLNSKADVYFQYTSDIPHVYVGGICGSNGNVVSNCSTKDTTIYGESNSNTDDVYRSAVIVLGGIVGSNNANGQIQNCLSVENHVFAEAHHRIFDSLWANLLNPPIKTFAHIRIAGLAGANEGTAIVQNSVAYRNMFDLNGNPETEINHEKNWYKGWGYRDYYYKYGDNAVLNNEIYTHLNRDSFIGYNTSTGSISHCYTDNKIYGYNTTNGSTTIVNVSSPSTNARDISELISATDFTAAIGRNWYLTGGNPELKECIGAYAEYHPVYLLTTEDMFVPFGLRVYRLDNDGQVETNVYPYYALYEPKIDQFGSNTIKGIGYAGFQFEFDVIVECAHIHTELKGAVSATCTADGLTDGVYCNDCETYIADPEIVPMHHNWQDWETDDATQHFHTCQNCDVVEYEEHTWNDGEVTTPPTHTTEGVRTYTCEYCAQTKTETIAKLTDHSYDQYAKHDADCHQQICICGDIIYTAHRWNGGEITVYPTHMSSGIYTYICKDCGEIKEMVLPPLTEHSYGDWQKFDADQHKKICECGDIIYRAHTWDTGVETIAPTHLSTGLKIYTCLGCWETKTEVLPKISTHVYDQYQPYDADQHQNVCECGDVVYLPHNWNSGSVEIAPTQESDGKMLYTCTECGETKSRVIPAMTLTLKGRGEKQYYIITKVDTLSSGEIVLPSSINGVPVTHIGKNAFRGCTELTSVIIPEGITTIGHAVFMECTNLKSVTIPKTVKALGTYMFANCTALTDVTLSKGVTTIGGSAFRGCTALTGITIPTSVTTISTSAFRGCRGLTSIVIPNTVKSLGHAAFYGCAYLTNVTIGSGIETLPNYAFNNCRNLKKVIIRNGVKTIGDYAFRDCIQLTSIILPDSVTTIGNSAFRGCKRLENLTVSANLTSIGRMTFVNCAKLNDLVLPATLKSIGYNAFSGCSALKSVYYYGSKSAWSNITIDTNTVLLRADRYYYSKLQPTTSGSWWYMNDDVPTVWEVAPALEYTLSANNAYYTVTGIGTYKGSSLIIPATYSNLPVRIGERAFYECTTLRSVVVSEGITVIGQEAFRYCTGLDSIQLPESVTVLPFRVLANCTSLTNVTLSTKLATIEKQAFLSCTSLKSIVIPKSVGLIRENAFSGCTALNAVFYAGNSVHWGAITVEANTILTSATRYHYSASKPTGSGNYWRYVNGVATAW